jgi:hypothetical protein
MAFRRIRISFLLFVCVVAFVTLVIRRLENRLFAQNEKTTFEVQVKNDLKLDTGVPAVVLHCDPVVVTTATIGDVHCTAINNSTKEIRALVFSLSFSGDVDAKTTRIDSVGHQRGPERLIKETFLHPDFNESHVHKSIGPGQSMILDKGSDRRNGRVVGVNLSLDYIDFSDNTSLGPAQKAIDLMDLREGAAKYKDWLVEIYVKSGMQFDAILEAINKGSLPNVPLPFSQISGAKAYRTHFLEVYQKSGRTEVERYLNK